MMKSEHLIPIVGAIFLAAVVIALLYDPQSPLKSFLQPSPPPQPLTAPPPSPPSDVPGMPVFNPHDLKVIPKSLRWEALGPLDVVTGKIINTGQRTYERVFVTVTIYAPDRQTRIGEAIDMTGQLRPGEIWKFRAIPNVDDLPDRCWARVAEIVATAGD